MRSGRILDALLLISLAIALASCGVALHAAWHWPLVGDAALMRYVVLLLRAGRAPYRQIIDINLPGSYLSEALAMRVFGAGAIGLRLYDGFLCLAVVACASALAGTGWRPRLCGTTVGLFFVLIHLRDGVVEGGERDLLMAVLVVLAYIVLLRIPWNGNPACIWLFELLIGATFTIKPTLLPLAGVPLLLRYLERRSVRPGVGGRLGRGLGVGTMAGAVGALLTPGALALLWLHHTGSVTAFFAVLQSVDAAHSRLAHQSFVALLNHSVAPAPAVFVLALLLAFTLRVLDAESKLLLFGAACGLLSFVVQEKGFPYQRYPFLVLAFILIARIVAQGLQQKGWSAVLATSLVVLMGAALPPVYAATVQTYTHSAPFENALAGDLVRGHAVQGSVQCLDTVGGCVNTLLDLHLIQSTDFLYDCYAYQGSAEEQRRYRGALLHALRAARPQTIVLTNQFCLEQHYSFDRVESWPELTGFLQENYRRDGGWQADGEVRWWHQPETPPAYRLFARR